MNTMLVVAVAAAAAPGAAAAYADTGPTTRPSGLNIVFVLVDNMRSDAMSCAGHPFVKTPNIDRIAARGVRFTNAFVTTSLSSPSRASFITGTYAHTHGVRVTGRADPDASLPTFPKLLQAAGYETAFIGKWHMQPLASSRPGFDHWVSLRGQGTYDDPALDDNGQTVQVQGYTTDLLTDHAVNFLRSRHDKPFCLCLWHKAVDSPCTPAPRHQGLYADVQLPKPPSADDDLADKPAWIRAGLVRGQKRGEIAQSRPVPATVPTHPWDPQDQDILNWYRTLAGVDDSVGRVLETLSEMDLADRTMVIFASSSGFLHGEHGYRDERFAFEESIRIPLLVSGPGIDRPGRTIDQMVLNLDVAPTILDIAGLAVPQQMQGRSLRPLLAGSSPTWRDAFLYEYFEERLWPGIPTILAVRTTDGKYVRYPDIKDRDELYDLKTDPHELRNLAGSPAAADRLQRVQARLTELTQTTGYAQSTGLGSAERGGSLVLYYDFEGSDSWVADRSGNNYRAGIGRLRRVAGRSGNALSCDGANIVDVYKFPLLDPSKKPWTAAAWVKPAANAESGIILARGGMGAGYALGLRGGRPEFAVRVTQESGPVTAAAKEPIGQAWVHLVGAITSDRTVELYVNGKPVASASAGAFISEPPFESMQICGDLSTQVVSPELPRFRGLVDDVKLFDGLLTAEQISKLASE